MSPKNEQDLGKVKELLRGLNTLIDQKLGSSPIKMRYGISWGLFIVLAYLIVFLTVLLVMNNNLGSKLYVLSHGAWKEAIQSFFSLIPAILGALVVMIIGLILLVFVGKVAITFVRSDPTCGFKHTWYLWVVLLALVGGGALITLATKQKSKILWSYEAEGPIRSSPAIGADGDIYIVSNDRFLSNDEILYSITPSGTRWWKHELDLPEKVDAFPVIGPDGTIYSGSKDTVYAFTSDGKFKWKFGIPDDRKPWLIPAPAIGPDSTIYYLCNFRRGKNRFFRLYALKPSAQPKWQYTSDVRHEVDLSPIVGSEGTIYFTCTGNKNTYIYALKPDGEVDWKFPDNEDTVKVKLEEKVQTSLAIDGDGTIYFGCDDHFLYAVTPEGKLKWSYETDGPVRSSPTIGFRWNYILRIG